MAQPDGGLPFRALEEQAYHSYREWHDFLVLRIKELCDHLEIAPPGETLPALERQKPSEEKKEKKA